VEGSCKHSNEPLGSRKCWVSSSVAAQLAVSEEGLSSMKVASYGNRLFPILQMF
jgi:hypothetical protein